jgi:hypothetical protein
VGGSFMFGMRRRDLVALLGGAAVEMAVADEVIE